MVTTPRISAACRFSTSLMVAEEGAAEVASAPKERRATRPVAVKEGKSIVGLAWDWLGRTEGDVVNGEMVKERAEGVFYS